ncbi:MAG: protein kinase domain-containing protein [Rubrivivax sp.]|jgi:serine/threonine protein kinase
MSARPPHLARPVAPSDLPTHIGKYPIKGRLGSGATSEVFLARDEFHDRLVAIKRVKVDPLADDRDQHFQNCFFAAEAALVGRLNHPNVVQIYDAVTDAEAPYLVMEYVPGNTLRRYCRAHTLLPLDQILEIGFKCANALGYCYRQGLVHRDVKPANLLAQMEAGQIVDVKVTDFGSVLNLRSDRTQVYRVGSLAYMSPEQLDGDALDCRADLYSLAAVMYHLIAGRPPFDATQAAALMHQIHLAEPPALATLREGVPPALADLVHRALQKKREDRQPSWEAFADELSAIVSRGDVPRGPLQSLRDSERFTLLRPLEFFAEFTDAELWEVVHRAKWRRYAFGDALYRKGQTGKTFHIITGGQIEVYRDGQRVAQLGPGTSVGEMAYLAPSADLAEHSADVLVSEPATTLSFTPDSLSQLTAATRHRFDRAFIHVLVRRLHAAHEALHHPRRIL